MKVLIVDDDAAVRELLGEMAEGLGHEVYWAGHGHEALRLLEEKRVQVVITDWLMPGIDGLELTRQVRAAKRIRYTYVIMLTALGGTARYLEGMRAGVDDFATKPVSPEELHARLRVAERVLRLQDDVKLLEGLLHICMYCKKVRVAGDDWTTIERYIEERSDASFSHDICPGCYATRVVPDVERFTGQVHDAEPRDERDRR